MTWKVSFSTHFPAGQLSVCKLTQIKFGVECAFPLPKSAQVGFLHPHKCWKDVLLIQLILSSIFAKVLLIWRCLKVWPLLHS